MRTGLEKQIALNHLGVRSYLLAMRRPPDDCADSYAAAHLRLKHCSLLMPTPLAFHWAVLSVRTFGEARIKLPEKFKGSVCVKLHAQEHVHDCYISAVRAVNSISPPFPRTAITIHENRQKPIKFIHVPLANPSKSRHAIPSIVDWVQGWSTWPGLR
eukprot:6490706-Amphidinium_carterae.2